MPWQNRKQPRSESTFAHVLRRRRYHGLSLRTQVYADQTHNSVFPLALSDGIRFLHDGR